jgi:hypothetical protein
MRKQQPITGFERCSDQDYVLREGRLLPATPELIAEVAHDVMLLSQGSERAIQMRAEAMPGHPDAV